MPDFAHQNGPELRRGTPDVAQSERRRDRIRAFRAELDTLQAEGVITLTQEQRDAVDKHHRHLLRALAPRRDDPATLTQLSLGIRTASLVAALALIATIYSLVARFWGRLELPLQATLLCLFPLASLIAVEMSAQRERTLYVASIFAAVAFATYWLAVGELSQLMNLRLAPPAIWGGALFGVALAVPYKFRLIYAGALIAMLVALAGSVFEAAGSHWMAVAEFPEILTAAALLLAVVSSRLQLVDPSFVAVTRGVAFTMAFLGLLMLSTAGRTSLLPTATRTSEAIYQVIAMVVMLAAVATATRRRWMETVYIAAAALTIFMLLRFAEWFWETLPRYLFFLLLSAMAFAWLWVLARMRRRLQVDAA